MVKFNQRECTMKLDTYYKIKSLKKAAREKVKAHSKSFYKLSTLLAIVKSISVIIIVSWVYQWMLQTSTLYTLKVSPSSPLPVTIAIACNLALTAIFISNIDDIGYHEYSYYDGLQNYKQWGTNWMKVGITMRLTGSLSFISFIPLLIGGWLNTQGNPYWSYMIPVGLIVGLLGYLYARYTYALAQIETIIMPTSSYAALKQSRKKMKGHRIFLFLTDLSFIGWNLLNIATLGLINIYLIPYKQMLLIELRKELTK